MFPLIGALAGFGFGVLFGSVASTRRGGIAFAMISLGLGELVSSSSFILRGFFGGEEGITTNRTKAAAVRLKFGPQIEIYYLIAAWCSGRDDDDPGAGGAPRSGASGARCATIPSASSSSAIAPRRCASGPSCLRRLFAGLAGGLSAVDFEIMNAQQLGAQQSGLVLLMTYVGGVGHFFGPLLGAAIITCLQARLSDLTDVWQLYFGLLFIGVVMLAPGGLAGWIAMHVGAWRRGELARLAPAYAAAAPAIVVAVPRRRGDDRTRASVLHEFARGAPVWQIGDLALNAATAGPWLAALALDVVGVVALLWAWPRVRLAWNGTAAAAPKVAPA